VQEPRTACLVPSLNSCLQVVSTSSHTAWGNMQRLHELPKTWCLFCLGLFVWKVGCEAVRSWCFTLACRMSSVHLYDVPVCRYLGTCLELGPWSPGPQVRWAFYSRRVRARGFPIYIRVAQAGSMYTYTVWAFSVSDCTRARVHRQASAEHKDLVGALEQLRAFGGQISEAVCKKSVTPTVGLEPTTTRLRAWRSTD
jgi:hypothetical protein